MNYVVTEPGLTILSYGQKLTPAAYANMCRVFSADSFAVAPYSRKLQQQVRAANPNIWFSTPMQVVETYNV